LHCSHRAASSHLIVTVTNIDQTTIQISPAEPNQGYLSAPHFDYDSDPDNSPAKIA